MAKALDLQQPACPQPSTDSVRPVTAAGALGGPAVPHRRTEFDVRSRAAALRLAIGKNLTAHAYF